MSEVGGVGGGCFEAHRGGGRKACAKRYPLVK